jgi:phage shock protein B
VNNPFSMVVGIVFIVMVASVIRAWLHSRRPVGGSVSPEERAETMRLRDEVKQLKERIHVLERIATDRENSLSRQIEELRDR